MRKLKELKAEIFYMTLLKYPNLIRLNCKDKSVWPCKGLFWHQWDSSGWHRPQLQISEQWSQDWKTKIMKTQINFTCINKQTTGHRSKWKFVKWSCSQWLSLMPQCNNKCHLFTSSKLQFANHLSKHVKIFVSVKNYRKILKIWKTLDQLQDGRKSPVQGNARIQRQRRTSAS